MDGIQSRNRSADGRIAEVDKDLSALSAPGTDLAIAQIQATLAVARAIQEQTEVLYGIQQTLGLLR